MCGKQGMLVSEQYVMACLNEQAMRWKWHVLLLEDTQSGL